jgi:hypothetical protein
MAEEDKVLVRVFLLTFDLLLVLVLALSCLALSRCLLDAAVVCLWLGLGLVLGLAWSCVGPVMQTNSSLKYFSGCKK